MKRHLAILLCFGLGLLCAQHGLGAEAQAATNNAALSRLGPPVKTLWATTSRKVNETRWQSVTIRTNTATGRLVIRTNSYVELGAGINVPAGSNIFVRANPAFQITGTGAEATGTLHKVYVPADIGSGEGITVIKPDGQQLTFQPLGLNYFDPTDGRSVLLDTATNAVGWLTASNEVVFSNCFTTIKASIRIRNSPSGFEHDVILHERPIDPTNVGLSSAARLEILTEQLAGATPGASEAVIRQETDPVKRATMLQPDFTDSVLQFGGTNGMKMGRGKAFAVGNPTNAWNSAIQHPVGKTYLTIENRRILIEAVEHRRALPALELLPFATNAPSFTNAAMEKAPTDRQMAQFTRRLPTLAARSENKTPAASIRTVAAPVQNSTGTLLAATAPLKTPGFVIDYGLYTFTSYAETDFTFRGDTTYVVTEGIYFDGTITIEGGTVVKLAPYVPLYVDPEATIVCDTTNYLPAVFTAYDDESVGEIPGGSDGVTSTDGGGFYFFSGNWEFRNVRFTHLYCPFVSEGGTITLRNAQIIDSFVGFECGTVQINVFNGLFKDCAIIYEGGAPSFRGEHVTIHNATMLGYSYAPESTTAAITNSLLVAITDPLDANVGTYVQGQSTYVSSGSGVFEVVEGGAHYLLASASSQRSVAASVNIDSTLKKELSAMTTHAPDVHTGTPSTDLSLSPSNVRDISTIGYHYPAIDYVVKDLTLENKTMTLSNGVVVAAAFTETSTDSAIHLAPGKFISVGTPTTMNRILRLSQVQESSVARRDHVISDGDEDTFKPRLLLRFTEFSALAGEPGHISLAGDFDRAEVCHNTFQNGGLDCHYTSGAYQLVGLTNNLWRSVNTEFVGLSTAYLYLYNNTYKGGYFDLSGGNSTWQIYDNLFDQTERTVDSSAVNSSFNAYIGLDEGDQDPLPTDVWFVTYDALSYGNGPLGRFYMPVELENGGSRYADAAALFHFTTRIDQTKETTSWVDIGFHYVALNSENQPFDFEPDGLADYLEDTTGNGLFGSGDLSDYRNKDSDGDGLDDAYEYNTSHTTLTVADTGTTGTSDGYKDSDEDGLTNQEEMQRGTNPLVPDVAEPLFSPVGSTYSSGSFPKAVTVTCPTETVIIRYTLNGDEPTEFTMTTVSSGDPVSVPVNSWLKAKAFKTGWTTSDTRSERYQTAANTAPTVSLLPGTATFTGSESIELLVQAADSGGIAKVQLFRDNYKVAETTESVLRFNLNNVPSGTYSFTARAMDNQGAVTVSSSVELTIASSGPVVSLFGAQPFFTSSPGVLVGNITGVNPGDLSSMTLNGNAIPLRAGEFMLFPALSEGENTFTLLVNGSVSVSTKVYLDTTAPSIAIAKPANSSSLSTERINVTGTYSESNLKRITVNGVLAFASSGNYEARNVPLVEGSQEIIAKIEDIAGNTVSVTNVVTGSATPVDPVQLAATPVAGYSSLSVTFSIPVQNVSGTAYIDFDGSGGQAAYSSSHSYSAGQYFPVVTIQTTDGNRFSSLGGWNAGSAFRVNVQEAPEQLMIGSQDYISITDPIDLKVGGPDGHLYVLSRSTRSIKEYDSSGTEVRSLSSIGTSSSTPTGLDVDSAGNLYVALSGDHQVAKYKLNSGGSYVLDTTFHSTGLIGKSNHTSGAGDGEFNAPYDVAVLPDGQEIVVSDSGNHRIQRFSVSGQFLGSFGEEGDDLGQFDTPKGIAYDSVGCLYIVDSGNSRVVLALSGSTVGTSGSSGSAIGQFSGVVNLGVGNRGIYVADAGNNRVQEFEPIKRGGHGTAAVTPFNPRGTLSSQLATALSGPSAVASVAHFTEERVYIADTANGRVVLVKFPLDNPSSIWTGMKDSLIAEDIDAAIQHFSSVSADNYQKAFRSIGAAALHAIMSDIPALTPVVIESDSAQYYFDQVISGETITFPIEFVKENGKWKILEY